MEKVDRTNRSDVKFPTTECGGRVDKVRNVNEIETCSEHSTGKKKKKNRKTIIQQILYIHMYMGFRCAIVGTLWTIDGQVAKTIEECTDSGLQWSIQGGG